MSTGSVLAPWLMAVGALLVALAILTSEDAWKFISIHLPKLWQQALISIAICGLFFIPVLKYFQNVADNRSEVLSKTPIFYGELTPGNEPTPPSPSYSLPGHYITPIPTDSFRVMLGDDSGIYIRGTVDNIFYLKDKPILTIKTNVDGTVLLNTEVVDSTNHKIVKIIDNEFQANPEYAFRPRQPDKHSLVVRDSDGVEVLNIRYINSKTIWITGRFYSQGDPQPVAVFPSGLIEFGDMKMRHVYVNPILTGDIIYLDKQDK